MIRKIKESLGLFLVSLGTRISLKETDNIVTNGVIDQHMNCIMQNINGYIDKFDPDSEIAPISMFHVEAIINTLSEKDFVKQKATAKSVEQGYYKSIWTHKKN